MKSPLLESNQELLAYLIELRKLLQSKGEIYLAKEVDVVTRFASGSASEFLSEAERILKKVRINNHDTLDKEQLSDIQNVIRQIQIAFIKIGGA